MADWGPFVKGLAGTLPQVGFQAYALRQRDEALAREEKRLVEQMKKQEINEAQQSLYKGLEWSEKLSDDVKPQIIDSMIVPAIKTLTKHNIMSYNDEQVQEFATKLKGNVTVGGQFMKDFKNIIDLNTDKKTGSVNYKEILKGVDMLLPTYGKKLTENEMKVAEIQKQNVARQGVTDPNTTPEDKKLLGSYLPANAQKALGIGEGVKPAPQRSFMGQGGKTMRVNQVWDEAAGAYKDSGEPWEFKDPATVVKVTAGARGGGAGELTDDALTVAAHQYLRMGQMPPLGMGSMGARAKILNKAGELAKSSGIDPETVPALVSEFKATQGALNKMERDYAGFAAFEQGMIKNMDYALSVSKKYGRTPLPPVNTLINALRTKTGDPQIVEYTNAIYAAAMEYEKIRTAGTAITSAELSVAAQKKAEDLINTAQTHGQLVGAAKAMRTDARNIIGSRKDEIGRLRSELKNSPYATTGTQQADPLGIRK